MLKKRGTQRIQTLFFLSTTSLIFTSCSFSSIQWNGFVPSFKKDSCGVIWTDPKKLYEEPTVSQENKTVSAENCTLSPLECPKEGVIYSEIDDQPIYYTPKADCTGVPYYEDVCPMKIERRDNEGLIPDKQFDEVLQRAKGSSYEEDFPKKEEEPTLQREKIKSTTIPSRQRSNVKDVAPKAASESVLPPEEPPPEEARIPSETREKSVPKTEIPEDADFYFNKIIQDVLLKKKKQNEQKKSSP
jgi:hypothetical protein